MNTVSMKIHDKLCNNYAKAIKEVEVKNEAIDLHFDFVHIWSNDNRMY